MINESKKVGKLNFENQCVHRDFSSNLGSSPCFYLYVYKLRMWRVSSQVSVLQRRGRCFLKNANIFLILFRCVYSMSLLSCWVRFSNCIVLCVVCCFSGYPRLLQHRYAINSSCSISAPSTQRLTSQIRSISLVSYESDQEAKNSSVFPPSVDNLLYSPSDLTTYIDCSHATVLDFVSQFALERPPARDDAFLKLLQKKGLEHEALYLESLRAQGLDVAEIPDPRSSQTNLEMCITLTEEAMLNGADVIFQAALYHHPWRGYADFLFKVPLPPKTQTQSKSNKSHNSQPEQTGLGYTYTYEVADTKLARNPKPSHVLQLSVYSDLVNQTIQRILVNPPPPSLRAPEHMHVILAGNKQIKFKIQEYSYYTQAVMKRFENLLNLCQTTFSSSSTSLLVSPTPHSSSSSFTYNLTPESTKVKINEIISKISKPEPNKFCSMCRWQERCSSQWKKEVITLIARITPITLITLILRTH